jgi:hypothetical protein
MYGNYRCSRSPPEGLQSDAISNVCGTSDKAKFTTCVKGTLDDLPGRTERECIEERPIGAATKAQTMQMSHLDRSHSSHDWLTVSTAEYLLTGEVHRLGAPFFCEECHRGWACFSLSNMKLGASPDIVRLQRLCVSAAVEHRKRLRTLHSSSSGPVHIPNNAVTFDDPSTGRTTDDASKEIAQAGADSSSIFEMPLGLDYLERLDRRAHGTRMETYLLSSGCV